MTRGSAALAAALVLAASDACSARTRQGVLEFFFDGVPPAGSPAASRSGGTAATTKVSPAVLDYEHGPYAAKMCDACHETGRANALVVPRDQLCTRCHRIAFGRRFVHGPISAGGCLLCHDPHRSRYRYLLAGDSAVFCLRCHDRAALRPVAGHEAGGSCTGCHEAHMSDRRFLLR